MNTLLISNFSDQCTLTYTHFWRAFRRGIISSHRIDTLLRITSFKSKIPNCKILYVPGKPAFILDSDEHSHQIEEQFKVEWRKKCEDFQKFLTLVSVLNIIYN